MSDAASKITTSRAAKLLDQCESTVRGKARRGELPCTRTESGIYLFDREVIERLARERTEAAHSRERQEQSLEGVRRDAR